MSRSSTLFAVSCLLVACGPMDGQRAASGDSSLFQQGGTYVCPAGDTCSSRTPRGLVFACGDGDGPLPIATGGTETITIQDNDGGKNPPAFDVVMTGGAGASITSLSTVVVTATQTSDLRVLEKGTQLLEDKITLTVEDPKTVTLVPSSWRLPTSAKADFVIARGQPFHVWTDIRSAAGHLLADESAQVTGAQRVSWVEFLVDSYDGDSLAVSTSNGTSATVPFPAVDTLDSMPVWLDFGDFVATRVGDPLIACFDPQAGGKHVVAENIIIESSGTIVGNDWSSTNCAIVQADKEGPLTVTATAVGLQTTLTLVILPAKPSSAAPGAVPASTPARRAAPGARASMGSSGEELGAPNWGGAAIIEASRRRRMRPPASAPDCRERRASSADSRWIAGPPCAA